MKIAGKLSVLIVFLVFIWIGQESVFAQSIERYSGNPMNANSDVLAENNLSSLSDASLSSLTEEQELIQLDQPLIVSKSGYNLYTFTPLDSGRYTLKSDSHDGINVAVYKGIGADLLLTDDYYDSQISFFAVRNETYTIEIYSAESLNKVLLTKTGQLTIESSVDISLTEDSFETLEFIPKQSGQYKIITGAYGGFGYSSPTYIEVYNENGNILAYGPPATINLSEGQKIYIEVSTHEQGVLLHTRVHITSTSDSDIIEGIPVDLSINKDNYVTFEWRPSVTGNYTLFTDYYNGENNGTEPNTILTLYDEQYNLLASNNDRDRQSVLSSLSVDVQSHTTYYVRVEGFGGEKINTRLITVPTTLDLIPPAPPVIIAYSNKDYVSGQWTNRKVTFNVSYNTFLPDYNIFQIKWGDSAEWKDITPYDYIDIDTDGTTNISARIIDNSENISDVSLLEVKIDKTKPSKPSFSEYKRSNGIIYFSILDGIDSGSGILKSQYKVGETGGWEDYLGGTVTITDENKIIYIRSIDKAGNISDENIFDLTAPTQPTALKISSQTATSVTLSWTASTDNIGVVGYNLYNGDQLLAELTNVTSYNLTGLISTNQYSLNVKARDAFGNLSSSSNVVVPDLTPPTQPTSLKISSQAATSVTLNWTASTDNVGVTGYDLYNGSELIVQLGNVTTYTITGLKLSETYSFSVRARDAFGNVSNLSNIVTVGKSRNLKYNYDNLGRLISIVDSDSGVTLLTYVYDANGNIIAIVAG